MRLVRYVFMIHAYVFIVLQSLLNFNDQVLWLFLMVLRTKAISGRLSSVTPNRCSSEVLSPMGRQVMITL